MTIAALWRTVPSLLLIGLLALYASLAARSGVAPPPASHAEWLLGGGVGIGKIAIGLGLAGGSALLVWLMAGDGARLVSMAVPEILAWASAFEITTLIDALVAVGLLSAGARLRAVSLAARAAGAACARWWLKVKVLARAPRP